MTQLALIDPEAVYRDAFLTPREPRSNPYKAGVLAALRYRAGALPTLRGVCPFPTGTPSADAWRAGCDEGHALWRAAVRS